MKATLPEEFKKYFWDTAIENIDLKENKDYVVGKILEYGNARAIKWLFNTYDKKAIYQVTQTNRELSTNTAKAWERYLYAS